MVTSINAGQVLDRVQHPFMTEPQQNKYNRNVSQCIKDYPQLTSYSES